MNEFKTLNVAHAQQFLDYLQFETRNRKSIEDEVNEELQDLLNSRITESNTYTGKEVIDALEDVPDLIENVMDRQLEHLRDITMVLIKSTFLQAKENNVGVTIPINQLEEETILHNAHEYCSDLLKKPEEVLAEAPKVEGYIPKTKSKATNESLTPQQELDLLRNQNATLKADIQNGLDTFPQYKKTKQMIHEREIEIRGMKARL